MNDYRITLTKRAKDDIIDIGDYITYTLLEPDISRKFIKSLRNSISQLQFFPYKFPLVQDNILRTQSILLQFIYCEVENGRLIPYFMKFPYLMKRIPLPKN